MSDTTTVHNKSKVTTILSEMFSPQLIKRAQFSNHQRLANLLKIVDNEEIIYSNMSDEITTLVHDILVISTPSKVLYFSRFNGIEKPNTETEEDIMRTIPLLYSPLIDVLSKQERADLEDGIIVLIQDVLESRWDCKNNPVISFPFNFNLIGGVIKNPDYTEKVFYYDRNLMIPVIYWAFTENTSFLSHIPAGYLSESLYKAVTPIVKATINTHLKSKNINQDLFWDMVDTAPSLPALTIINLLSKEGAHEL